jgi:nitrite reductase/ring-hydroxylating ferredoxin subunit
MIKTRKLLRFILPFAFLLFACSKDTRHPIPDVRVDFFINIESTQNIELNAIGGWAYYTGGFYNNGIIIYRHSIDEFMAFDRTCPHHPYEPDARIRVFDPPLAIDTLCGSRFLLIDGSVVDGPSRHPLKQYRTYYNPPYLQVTN